MRPANYITLFNRVARLPIMGTRRALELWRLAVCASPKVDSVSSRPLTLRGEGLAGIYVTLLAGDARSGPGQIYPTVPPTLCTRTGLRIDLYDPQVLDVWEPVAVNKGAKSPYIYCLR